jgi:hypothetical protein
LDVLREVMKALNSAWQLNLQGPDTADAKKLRVTAVKVLKQKSGPHA